MQNRRYLDLTALFFFACLFAGWYVFDLIVVTVGPIRYGFRFQSAWSLIAHPVQTLAAATSGVKSKNGLFAVACAGAMVLPLLPHVIRRRAAWFAYAAPLLLMCVCGAYAYGKFSGSTFATAYHPSTLGEHLTDFANHVIDRAGSFGARKIKIGTGLYLSTAASVALAAVGGIRYMGRE